MLTSKFVFVGWVFFFLGFCFLFLPSGHCGLDLWAGVSYDLVRSLFKLGLDALASLAFGAAGSL